MWVVYNWERYEGNWGHTYFRSKEKAEQFKRNMEADSCYTNWEIEEIIFHDEE